MSITNDIWQNIVPYLTKQDTKVIKSVSHTWKQGIETIDSKVKIGSRLCVSCRKGTLNRSFLIATETSRMRTSRVIENKKDGWEHKPVCDECVRNKICCTCGNLGEWTEEIGWEHEYWNSDLEDYTMLQQGEMFYPCGECLYNYECD